MIDADALIAQIETNICKPCRERKDDYHGVRCRACQYGDEIDDIDSAPTIEERKTGEWEHHYSRPNVYADLCWHCSCCGYKTPDNWANKWNFCPNCGASMMEGEQI